MAAPAHAGGLDDEGPLIIESMLVEILEEQGEGPFDPDDALGFLGMDRTDAVALDDGEQSGPDQRQGEGELQGDHEHGDEQGEDGLAARAVAPIGPCSVQY